MIKLEYGGVGLNTKLLDHGFLIKFGSTDSRELLDHGFLIKFGSTDTREPLEDFRAYKNSLLSHVGLTNNLK